MVKAGLIFIHGLSGGPDEAGSQKYWGRFPELIKLDAELAPRYDVLFFSYPSSKVKGWESTPVPGSAQLLANEIDTKWNRYDTFDVIAHSQGGLVLRRYIADRVMAGRPLKLGRAILYDTPNTGAALARAAALPIIKFGTSREAQDLGYGSQMLQELLRDEAQHDAHLNVPQFFVVAGNPDFVDKTSAWGIGHPSSSYTVLPGHNHMSIIAPRYAEDPIFCAAKSYLLDANAGAGDDPKARHMQPTLSAKQYLDHSATDSETGRFVYWNRAVPFAGRDVEIAHIEDFLLAPNRRFQWMLMTGVGGMGKSRLALEMVLQQLVNHWRAGFIELAFEDAEYWRTWQPSRPTLLVVDYAEREIEKVEILLRGLAGREGARSLRRPVRVLLLDRRSDDKQWQDMQSRLGRVATGSARAPDLELPVMDVAHIIRHVLGPDRHSEADETAVREALMRIDPISQRPLYAYLIADAVRAGRDPLGWDRDALLRDIIDRERVNFWRPQAVALGLGGRVEQDATERVLALATMCNGFPLSAFAPRGDELLPPWQPTAHSIIFKNMTGRAVDEKVPPLEPDIIGEFFVLEMLRALDHARLTSGGTMAGALVAKAWDADAHRTAEFFRRVGDDFAEYSSDVRQWVLRLTTDSPSERETWCRLGANLVTSWSKLPAAWANAEVVYRKVAALVSTDASLKEQQTVSALSLCSILGTEAEWRELVVAIYDDLRGLASAPNAEPYDRECQALAAAMLSEHLGADAMWHERALAIYEDIRRLALEHGSEPDIGLWQAELGRNLCVHLSAVAGLRERVRTIYWDLRNIASTDHIRKPHLLRHQAEAGFGICCHLNGLSEWLEYALPIYSDLRGLTSVPGTEPLLRVAQGRIGVDLCYQLSTDEKWREEAVTIYEDLRGLASMYAAAEPVLREQQASAGSNLCLSLGPTAQWRDRAVSVYRDLAELGPEPVLRDRQARAAFCLIVSMLEGDKSTQVLDLAYDLYLDLRTLSGVPNIDTLVGTAAKQLGPRVKCKDPARWEIVQADLDRLEGRTETAL